MSLIITGIGIGSELIADFVARSIINLTIKTKLGAVLVIGVPSNDITVIIEDGYLGIPLMVRRISIDFKLFTNRSTVNIVALRIDAITTAILVIGFPGYNKTAITKTVYRWVTLVT